MRRTTLSWVTLACLCAGVGGAIAQVQPPSWPPTESLYAASLHASNRGIEFLYSAQQGGLEVITGVSAREAGCIKARCHATTCDTCHLQEVGGKPAFTVAQARTEEACRRCHGDLAKDNPDVHFAGGLACMSCHTSREIHGDGTGFDTYQQPGVFDVTCERCHPGLEWSASHTVHGGKLDCKACHVKELVTCYNCHVDTRLADGKDVQLEVTNQLFLVNHDGRVTLGNLLSYVSGNRTMVTVATAFGHKVQKRGRACPDCHATPVVASAAAGALELARWEGGALRTTPGVIPLVEGMGWRLPFLSHSKGVWTLLERPTAPVVKFQYCTPLSRSQLGSLEKPRGTGRS